MDDDWSWDIEYGTIMDRNYNQRAAAPRPILTGTNLEVNCRDGQIQLRRSPTGILLDEAACQLSTRFCTPACEMFKDKSLSQMLVAMFNVKPQ